MKLKDLWGLEVIFRFSDRNKENFFSVILSSRTLLNQNALKYFICEMLIWSCQQRRRSKNYQMANQKKTGYYLQKKNHGLFFHLFLV